MSNLVDIAIKYVFCCKDYKYFIYKDVDLSKFTQEENR